MWIAHGKGAHAPGKEEPAELPYTIGHIVLKCHAAAWHLYNDTYRATQEGEIIYIRHPLMKIRSWYISVSLS